MSLGVTRPVLDGPPVQRSISRTSNAITTEEGGPHRSASSHHPEKSAITAQSLPDDDPVVGLGVRNSGGLRRRASNPLAGSMSSRGRAFSMENGRAAVAIDLVGSGGGTGRGTMVSGKVWSKVANDVGDNNGYGGRSLTHSLKFPRRTLGGARTSTLTGLNTSTARLRRRNCLE